MFPQKMPPKFPTYSRYVNSIPYYPTVLFYAALFS
jgi:hypothetical protein